MKGFWYVVAALSVLLLALCGYVAIVAAREGNYGLMAYEMFLYVVNGWNLWSAIQGIARESAREEARRRVQ